jgi:nucleotide-binding universal stress UspA family protein
VQQELDDAAAAAPAGVNPRTLVLHGEPVTQIRAATEGVVDVLFSGSRGYGPLQRVLIGSVAEDLIRGATHPIVVLPRRRA